MDVLHWAKSFGEKGPRGNRRGSLKHLSGWAGNRLVRPTSVGDYSVTESYAKPIQTKRLNPNAKAWSPFLHCAPEEDRCLFVTFSNGRLITENEITNSLLEKKYGDCLERVYVHRPKQKNCEDIKTPQFGKVTFKGSLIPLTINNCGKKQPKFRVRGKPLWCMKFDPDKKKAFKRSQIIIFCFIT